MLLARLEGEDVAAASLDVGRLPDDPAGHPARELLARGDEAIVRPAVGERVAGRLPLADRDRAAVAAGSLEHAERHRVDMGDRQRLGVVRGRCQLRRRLQAAEEVRLLEDRAGGVLGRCAELLGVGDAVAVRHVDDLHPEARRVGPDDLAHLRVEVSARTIFERPVACFAM